MEPLKTYDYLVLARARVLGWARPLTAEQHLKQFPIGLGSLARTLTHVMGSEWFYMQRMQQLPVPPYEQWAIKDENPPVFAVIEAEWTRQAERTRAALAAVKDWSEQIEYRTLPHPGEPINIITATRGDIFTQFVLHEVHHRAQAMNMLRHLGVAVSDIDYNTLMYRRRHAEA